MSSPFSSTSTRSSPSTPTLGPPLCTGPRIGMQRVQWTPTGMSPSDTKATISRQRVEWTPSMAWISWDPIEAEVHSVTPLPKKPRLKGGQVTLTQLATDPAFKKSGLEDLTSTGESPAAAVEDKEDLQSYPKVVPNDILAGLLWELWENCSVMMEQIETTYPWFTPTAFPQRKWIQELPEAIAAVKRCPGLVSVMGLKDMKRFLPTVTNNHTFVLLKQLAVNHFFHLLLDLDQFSVTASFKFIHKEGRIGAAAWTYGTDEDVLEDIFYPDE